ncbi:hypothetical protein [Streptomyces sp. 8L]|uniref:hypothetical protein n=1 Tax=Streptomyces sp. 8L TaxID=2877242 RepID=UPI001CD6D7AA|nr:hypothetical protein [Streptomyces sp. 8L]MCA1221105.1 hypothetical protein [Streptomyces sp. 8L]
MIEVLLLGRYLPHEHIVAGLAAALRAGAMTADAVALETRKAAQAETEPDLAGRPLLGETLENRLYPMAAVSAHTLTG